MGMKRRGVRGFQCVALSMGIALMSFTHAQPADRQQFLLGSQTEANALGKAAYQKVIDAASARGDLLTNGAEYERIKRISDRLIASAPEIRTDSDSWAWEVSLIRNEQLNAF